MKIVFLGKYNPTEKLTGPEKVAKRIFYEISEINRDVTFIEYFFKSDYSNLFLRLFGYKVESKKPLILKLGIIRLFIFLLKNQPDIIHIITSERFILSMFLYRFLIKSKIIVTIHGIIAQEIKNFRVPRSRFSNFKDLLCEKVILKFSNILIFLSKQQIQRVDKFYTLNKDKIRIIPNGVDRIFSDQKAKKEYLDVGNIVFYDNKDFDIKNSKKLFPILEALDYPINLYVLGNMNEYKGNKKLKIYNVDELNTFELVHFLKDKSILINPSEFDSFPLFPIECMAAGLIVIVSSNVGMSSYISNNINGFVFNHNDFDELKIILQRILSKEYDLKRISHMAKGISDELNWQVIGSKYNDLYKMSFTTYLNKR